MTDMTNEEFKEVLEVAMEYYKPHTGNRYHTGYMCVAITDGRENSKLSKEQAEKARIRILAIILPHITLNTYLSKKLNMRGRPVTNNELMKFWTDLIDTL